MSDTFHREGNDDKEVGNVILYVITDYILIPARGKAARHLN
jgi:hypothetical protein